MPDLEMFGDINPEDVRQVIADCAYESAITMIQGPALAYSIDGAAQAFIRVSATHQFKFMADLIARLRKLKIDLEIVKIETFYPKRELR